MKSPAAQRIDRWRNNVNLFALEALGFKADRWQEEGFEAASRPGITRIALMACAGPGKTAFEAVVVLHRLLCYGHKGEHIRGALVSSSKANLDSNLWPELAKWIYRSEILKATFTHTATRVYANDHPDTWFVQARSFAQSAKPEEIGQALDGIHSEYVVFVADEAGGIHPNIAKKAEQAIGNAKHGLFVVAGNTTSKAGLLYRVCIIEAEKWVVIPITGDPDDPKRSPRVNIDWAREMIEKHGREDAWVQAYILGQFPAGSIDTLLTDDDVRQAMTRHLKEDTYSWAQKRIGIDTARYGDDRTVIYPRQGLACGVPIIMRHPRDSSVSVNIANRVMGLKKEWGSELELFDGTGGWSAGAIDVMRANGHSPLSIDFGSTHVPEPRFLNMRAYCWWKMAEWVKAGGGIGGAPPEIMAELATPTYFYSDAGKIQIQDKDSVKELIGRSPDIADSLAVSFALPERPGLTEAEKMFGRKKIYMSMPENYNPLEGM